jgi:hypothetical protein
MFCGGFPGTVFRYQKKPFFRFGCLVKSPPHLPRTWSDMQLSVGRGDGARVGALVGEIGDLVGGDVGLFDGEDVGCIDLKHETVKVVVARMLPDCLAHDLRPIGASVFSLNLTEAVRASRIHVS